MADELLCSSFMVEEKGGAPIYFNKAGLGFLFFWSSIALILLLAGRCGEEARSGSLAGWWIAGLEEFRKDQSCKLENNPWRLDFAAIICGHTCGLSRCPCWHQFNLHQGGPSMEQHWCSSPSLP
jgi:hypothetical protein